MHDGRGIEPAEQRLLKRHHVLHGQPTLGLPGPIVGQHPRNVRHAPSIQRWVVGGSSGQERAKTGLTRPSPRRVFVPHRRPHLQPIGPDGLLGVAKLELACSHAAVEDPPFHGLFAHRQFSGAPTRPLDCLPYSNGPSSAFHGHG